MYLHHVLQQWANITFRRYINQRYYCQIVRYCISMYAIAAWLARHHNKFQSITRVKHTKNDFRSLCKLQLVMICQYASSVYAFSGWWQLGNANWLQTRIFICVLFENWLESVCCILNPINWKLVCCSAACALINMHAHNSNSAQLSVNH